MKTVTILKSDIDDSNYDSVLTAIDIELDGVDPGEETELRVIIKNDSEEENDEDETTTETEDQNNG